MISHRVIISANKPDEHCSQFYVAAYSREDYEHDLALIPLAELISDLCEELAQYPDANSAAQLAGILSMAAQTALAAAKRAQASDERPQFGTLQIMNEQIEKARLSE